MYDPTVMKLGNTVFWKIYSPTLNLGSVRQYITLTAQILLKNSVTTLEATFNNFDGTWSECLSWPFLCSKLDHVRPNTTSPGQIIVKHCSYPRDHTYALILIILGQIVYLDTIYSEFESGSHE